MVALGILAAVTVSACGGGGSSSATASAGGGEEATSGCAKEAKAAVEEARASIAPQIPSEPVDVSKNRGKKIWLISPTLQVSTQVAIKEGVEEAAAASGLKVEVYDGAGSATKYNDGLTRAVDQGADGIILQGIEPALVEAPLGKAEAAGIPMIDSMNGDPEDPLEHGLESHVTINFTQSGKLMADYILEKTNCKANVLELTSSLFTALKDKHQGFTEEMERLCPECKVDTEEVNFENLSSSVESVVRTGIQREPDTNYVMATDDSLAFYAVPTLQSLGSEVPVIAGNGDTENMEFARKGENQEADISFPPIKYIGWREVDLLQRAMAGQKVPSGEVPEQLIDSTNIAADEAEQFPKFQGFEKAFEKVWGVG
jgi:ABC-type sugar transport system substrate-binding protein